MLFPSPFGEPFVPFEEGDRERAEELYRRSLAVRPDQALARVNLGNILRQSERFAEAEGQYAAAAALGFVEGRFLVNYGMVLAVLGKRDEAREVWRRALDLPLAPPLRNAVRANLARLDS